MSTLTVNTDAFPVHAMVHPDEIGGVSEVKLDPKQLKVGVERLTNNQKAAEASAQTVVGSPAGPDATKKDNVAPVDASNVEGADASRSEDVVSSVEGNGNGKLPAQGGKRRTRGRKSSRRKQKGSSRRNRRKSNKRKRRNKK